jgi:beta-phosphoglucomutase-like phosphatase (HAD superfamily)
MKFPKQLVKDLTTVRDIVRDDTHSAIWLLAAAQLLDSVAAQIRAEVAAAGGIPDRSAGIEAAKQAGF